MNLFRSAWALAGFYRRSIPEKWYLKAPFLPVPPLKYVKWRLQTAYGLQRPPLRLLLKDLRQFGEWLAESD